MAQKAHEKTLFHLVPLNPEAEDALQHPDNRRFVSSSPIAGKPALEVGFHIPPFSRGHVITRLGRNTDLILRNSFSAVHVAFEIHPETFVVMLSVRTKRVSSVTVAPVMDETGNQIEPQSITGDCAIIYGQLYDITIASYIFRLTWRYPDASKSLESLKELATSGYRDSMSRLKDVRSRDLSLLEPSTPASWYMTRLQSAKAPLVVEADANMRILIGKGAYGKVYKTVDRMTGNFFAVKVVNLKAPEIINIELSRAALHKEIKILEALSHVCSIPFHLLNLLETTYLTGALDQENIIECLGTKDFDTDCPLIFMPKRPGSLESLVAAEDASDELCEQVLREMLSALDYLAFRKICHRDVKPQNILYDVVDQGRYRFQLSDFGMANDFRFAKTICGTPLYLAPEIRARQPQTPKIDVWSLFATIAVIHPRIAFPPKDIRSEDEIPHAIHAAAASIPPLMPMARINPTHRASAAQMLIALFNGQGLTTPRSSIPEISPEYPEPALEMVRPEPTFPQLVEYCRRDRQTRRPSRPTARHGVLPNRIPEYQPREQPVQRVPAPRDRVAKPLSPRVALPQRQPQQAEPLPKQQLPQRRPGNKPSPKFRDHEPEKKFPHKEEQKPTQERLPGVVKEVVQDSVLTPRLPGMFPELDAQTVSQEAPKA